MPPEPPPFDAVEILGALERHGVRFVLIGGFAAVLHGATIATRDIDITPAADEENLQRLANALAELGAGIRVDGEPPVQLPHDARLLASATIWNLTTRYGDLDISVIPSGTAGYDDLHRGASSRPVGRGVRIDVASIDDIIRSKEAAARPKDQATLPELRDVRARARQDLDLDR